MYFKKEVAAKNLNKGRKNLEDYFNDFNFTKDIYKDKILAVRNIHNDDETLIPDIAGSVVKKLFLGGWFAERRDVNLLLERGWDCCSAIIQNIGFSPTDNDGFFAIVNEKNENVINVMLVAGCQKSPMLKSRVEKAVEICLATKAQINIIFSGENPSIKGYDDLDTLSEAIDMKILFDDIWDTKKNPYPENLHFHLERESHNTKTNIEKVFAGNFFVKEKEINLIIVSSTFHLIRLSQDLETVITANKDNTKVKQVLLAGAENTKTKLTPNPDDAHYVKGMFTDIFRYLFSVNKPKTYTTAIV